MTTQMNSSDNSTCLRRIWSVICKIIFNDKKYKDIGTLSNDDLLSIQMLSQLKDRKENNIMKEQFIINQKVTKVCNFRLD